MANVEKFPELNACSIHVWQVDIRKQFNKIDYFFSLLNGEERQRAERFLKAIDKKRFIIARGVLRVLLAKYLKIDNFEIDFKCNKYGKPYLSNNFPIIFNVSHANNLAVFAFAKEGSIGVDVEFINDKLDFMSIAQRFFATQEYMALKNIVSEKQLEGFYEFWTRKEAFVKGLGEGIAYSLSKFAILPSFTAKPSRKLTLIDSWHSNDNWFLSDLEVPISYKAALAFCGQEASIFNLLYDEWC